MPKFILSIRKISLPPIAADLLFATLFGVYAFIVQQYIFQQPYIASFTPTAHAAYGQQQPLFEQVFFFHQPRTKTVLIHYYNQEFAIETGAKTFGELATFMPLAIEKEQLLKFWPVELVDGMEIRIPSDLYQTGVASWYGSYFHGRPTASTEPYNMYALTAAHRTLPLGTKVKVTNLLNKKTVVVRINDRGPYVGGRVIDLSFEAARQIGSVYRGLTHVAVEFVD